MFVKNKQNAYRLQTNNNQKPFAYEETFMRIIISRNGYRFSRRIRHRR